ncbi:hypothetical protein IT568_00670 [bacterium]|nr:hypothetical protein [bacterium]
MSDRKWILVFLFLVSVVFTTVKFSYQHFAVENNATKFANFYGKDFGLKVDSVSFKISSLAIFGLSVNLPDSSLNLTAKEILVGYSLRDFIFSGFKPEKAVEQIFVDEINATLFLPDSSKNDSSKLALPEIPEKVFQTIDRFYQVRKLFLSNVNFTLKQRKNNFTFKLVEDLNGLVSYKKESEILLVLKGFCGEANKTSIKIAGSVFPKSNSLLFNAFVDSLFVKDFQKFIPEALKDTKGKINVEAFLSKSSLKKIPTLRAKAEFDSIGIRFGKFGIENTKGFASLKDFEIDTLKLDGNFREANFSVFGKLGRVDSLVSDVSGNAKNVNLTLINDFLDEKNEFIPRGFVDLDFYGKGNLLNPSIDFKITSSEILQNIGFLDLKLENNNFSGKYFDLKLSDLNLHSETLGKKTDVQGQLNIAQLDNFFDLSYKISGKASEGFELKSLDSLLGKPNIVLQGKVSKKAAIPTIFGDVTLNFDEKNYQLFGNYFFDNDSAKLFLTDTLKLSKIVLAIKNPVDSLSYKIKAEKINPFLLKILPKAENLLKVYEPELYAEGKFDSANFLVNVRDLREEQKTFVKTEGIFTVKNAAANFKGDFFYEPKKDFEIGGSFEVLVDTQKVVVPTFTFADYFSAKGTYFLDEKINFQANIDSVDFEDIFTLLNLPNDFKIEGGKITGKTFVRGTVNKPEIKSNLSFENAKINNLEQINCKLSVLQTENLPQIRLKIQAEEKELVTLESEIENDVLEVKLLEQKVPLTTIFKIAGIDTTAISKEILGGLRIAGNVKIDKNLETNYFLNIANGDSFGINFEFPKTIPIDFNLRIKDKISDFSNLKEQTFEVESFDLNFDNDFLLSAEGKIPYSANSEELDLSIKSTGNFIGALPKLTDFFVLPTQTPENSISDTLLLGFAGSLGEPELTKTKLRIGQHFLRFTEIFKKKDFNFTKVEVDFESEKSDFLRVYAEGDFRGNRLIVRNFENPFVRKEGKYLFEEQPIFINSLGGLDLGLLAFETPQGLKRVNVTGFMGKDEEVRIEILEPNKKSDFVRNALFNPKMTKLAVEKLASSGISEDYAKKMNAIFVSGREDSYRLSGRLKSIDAEINLEFLEATEIDTSFFAKLIESIDFNIDFRIGPNNWFYQRSKFSGKKFRFDEDLTQYEIDVRLDESFKDLSIRGCMADKTFGLDGTVTTTLGTIEVWNKDFQVEHFNIIFDEHNEFPIFEGIATRVEKDEKTNLAFEIYVIPVRVDTINGIVTEFTDNVRLDTERMRFRIFSNNPELSNIYQILAYWGILGTGSDTNDENTTESINFGETGKKLIIDAGANYVDNFFHRYLKYAERRLVKLLPIDYIRIRPTFIQNLAEQLTVTSETIGTENSEQISSIKRPSLFSSSSISVGKQLPVKGVRLNYTGKLVNGYNQKKDKNLLGVKHNLGLEYKVTSRLFIQYEYSYDFELFNKRNDQKILIKHSFLIR